MTATQDSKAIRWRCGCKDADHCESPAKACQKVQRLEDEVTTLVALLRDCGAFIGPPEDHRPTSDDGMYALATRIAIALAPHWQLPDDTGGRAAMDPTWSEQ